MESSYTTHRAHLARERSVSYLADRRGRDGLRRKRDRLEPDVRRDASSVPSPASVVSGTISGPGISADICSGGHVRLPRAGHRRGLDRHQRRVRSGRHAIHNPVRRRERRPRELLWHQRHEAWRELQQLTGTAGTSPSARRYPLRRRSIVGTRSRIVPRGARRRAPRPRFSVSRWRRRTVTWPRARPTV